MKKSLVILIKYFLFWLVYFWLSNIIFLLTNYKLSSTLEFSEIAKILIIGTRMDLSMSGYLTLLPGIIITFSFLFSKKTTGIILKTYTIVLLIIATFLNILDLGLYPHWGTRVGISAFDYIGDIKGVFANITIFNALIAALSFLAYLILFTKIFNRFIYRDILKEFKLKWFFAPVLFFLTACLIIPIRGSFNTSPMNFSFVTFSDKLYANQAASNYLWHFLYTVDNRDLYNNPCIYFEHNRAQNIFTRTENKRIPSDTVIIDRNKNVSPNVILIILESFSNKIIPALGGQYNVCPNINALCKNSIAFSSFYASGNRSDRGISAILGGYPSLLETSIMRFPDKSDKLTLISDYFNRKNYKTSFYYGGDIEFYSLKSYLLQGNYTEIVSQDNFPSQLSRLSKWGVPDEYLFEKVSRDLNTSTEPFFKVVYTLSSHPPYDVPFNKIEGNSNEAKYLNAVAYTDSCLGSFITDFKKSKFWDNTLVIITADHGYVEPGPTDISDPKTYQIPLIWTGGLIKDKGILDYPGGQTDLVPTLVRQLGWEPDSTLFGHDLFSEPSYALYMHNSGWGYVTKQNKHFFNKSTGEFRNLEGKEVDESYFDFAKAYLQVLHDDFLKR